MESQVGSLIQTFIDSLSCVQLINVSDYDNEIDFEYSVCDPDAMLLRSDSKS